MNTLKKILVACTLATAFGCEVNNPPTEAPSSTTVIHDKTPSVNVTPPPTINVTPPATHTEEHTTTVVPPAGSGGSASTTTTTTG